MTIDDLANEEFRQREFPVSAQKAFFAHAAVTPLPRVASDALIAQARAATTSGTDNYAEVLKQIRAARETAARLIGGTAEEIALLGPTSLGLSLFAQGLDWAPGDEVLYHADDYPANVYPWLELARRGVVPRALRPERPGEITPDLIAASLTDRTRLVALASAYFLNGYRIDVDAIGRVLAERGVLFSVDGIQTLGAFPFSVEHVDFLSADAHKWMLGPPSIGIVYVKKRHFERLRPILVGASNVLSPQYVSQPEVVFTDTAARYEPGVLNFGPLLGMKASLDLILEVGLEVIAARIGALVQSLAEGLQDSGFEPVSHVAGPRASGILTVTHPAADLAKLFRVLQENRVTVSLRRDREDRTYLRWSPHFYNAQTEIERALEVVRNALA